MTQLFRGGRGYTIHTIRRDVRVSVPHTLFSPRQHGVVQARASTATARPRRPPIGAGARRPPIRARRRSRGGVAAGAQGRGRHFACMERDGIYAGELRRLRAEKPHHLGR